MWIGECVLVRWLSPVLIYWLSYGPVNRIREQLSLILIKMRESFVKGKSNKCSEIKEMCESHENPVHSLAPPCREWQGLSLIQRIARPKSSRKDIFCTFQIYHKFGIPQQIDLISKVRWLTHSRKWECYCAKNSEGREILRKLIND